MNGTADMIKERTLLTTFVILGVLLSGCVQDQRANGGNEIIIGALLPLTGDLSFSGQAARAALDTAVEDVNAYLANQEPGMKVRLVVEDTGSDPSIALEKIKRLKEASAVFVIGTDSSAELEAVKPYADENGIILISHGSTAPSLAIEGDNVFRLLPCDLHQAEALAALMHKDGIRAVVPIWRGDVWGDGLHDATIARFEALGGEVFEGVRYDPETDFSDEIDVLSSDAGKAVSRYGKDGVAVHFIGFNEAASLFIRARNISILQVRWYGSDGTALDTNLVSNPQAARFAEETGFVTPFYSVEIQDLEDRVRARGGAAHVFGLVAYDALWLSALSYIALNKSADAELLKSTLITTAASYQGVTGSTAFNEDGDRRFAVYDIWGVKERNGTFAWERVGRYPSDSQPFLTKNPAGIAHVLDQIDNFRNI